MRKGNGEGAWALIAKGKGREPLGWLEGYTKSRGLRCSMNSAVCTEVTMSMGRGERGAPGGGIGARGVL